MRREDFENLVDEAIFALPRNIKDKMDNVAVCVEENFLKEN